MTRSAASVLSLLFGLRARVRRGPYVAWGFALAAAKFVVDTAIVYGFARRAWSPLGYVVPSLTLRDVPQGGSSPWVMHVTLAAAAMPFLWIGVTMSVRRAADAGVSPWFGLGFLVPLVNYATIAVLALLPTRVEARWAPPPVTTPYRTGAERAGPPSVPLELPSGLSAALFGLLACIALGVGMIGISVYGLGAYGTVLFFATPFTMGAVSAAVYNGAYPRPLGKTVALALVGTVLTGSAVLLFALEGVVCLAMAFPIAAALAVTGATVAWAIANGTRGGRGRAAGLVLLLPAAAASEARALEPTLREVTTTIEIDAPPERVWPNVVGFSELTAPPAWIYRLGVAYPKRATIDGVGPGATRRCEFSTGAFVEPITVWDEPRRLAFDVAAQPPSMTEWSPYRAIRAPHLEGYMTSRRGEFRLVALPGERTRLEGTTWYTMALYPESYWVVFGELLLHGIHGRVLEHVKTLSEDDARPRRTR